MVLGGGGLEKDGVEPGFLRDRDKTEHFSVEVGGAGDVGDKKNRMVESDNAHALRLGGR